MVKGGRPVHVPPPVAPSRPPAPERRMYPHRIRLRGPWECQPLAPDGPPPRRVTLPCRWADGGLGDFRGPVRFRRRFGYPGRLDAHERVWLTFVPTGAE